jgi:hypothetical protein
MTGIWARAPPCRQLEHARRRYSFAMARYTKVLMRLAIQLAGDAMPRRWLGKRAVETHRREKVEVDASCATVLITIFDSSHRHQGLWWR